MFRILRLAPLNKTLLLPGLLLLLITFPGCGGEKGRMQEVVEDFMEALSDYDFDEAWKYLDFLMQQQEFGDFQSFKIWAAGKQYVRELEPYYNLEIRKVELVDEKNGRVSCWYAKGRTYTIFLMTKSGGRWRISEIKVGVDAAPSADA